MRFASTPYFGEAAAGVTSTYNDDLQAFTTNKQSVSHLQCHHLLINSCSSYEIPENTVSVLASIALDIPHKHPLDSSPCPQSPNSKPVMRYIRSLVDRRTGRDTKQV